RPVNAYKPTTNSNANLSSAYFRFWHTGTCRAREYSPGRINGQDVIVAQAIIWPEVQQNQAS
ncbi:hypothetical protein FXO06_11345, partial [Klebsiella pneumoniae]